MLLEFLLVVVLILLGLYALWKYITGNRSYWPSRNVQLIDSSKTMSAWDRWTFKYPLHEIEHMGYKTVKNAGVKTFCGTMEFRRPVFYVVDLDLVKHIMAKDFDYFVNRRSLPMEKSDPLFHKMLVSAKDQEWKDLRSTMSPTFTTGKIRRMYKCFNDSSTKLAEFLREETKKSTELEVRDVLKRYTLDVISSAAFGLDSQAFKDSNSIFCQMAHRFQDQFSGIKLVKIMVALLFPKLHKLIGFSLLDPQATDFFAKTFSETIKHRDSTGEKRDDFLQLLMESRKDGVDSASSVDIPEDKDTQLYGKTNKVKMTEDVMLAQSLLFFIGGFDTTETLLLFAAYELALNPEVQETLFEELKGAADENNGELDYDIIMNLKYLDKVISETLRKHPPGTRSERVASKPYQVPGSELILEKDTLVVVSTYGIHWDPDYYPDPEKFDPERFSDENKAKRHPYAYMPFGVGPRNCIANRFALAEGKSAIAHLILNFQLQPGPKTDIPLKFTKFAAIKPEGGIWLDFRPREKL